MAAESSPEAPYKKGDTIAVDYEVRDVLGTGGFGIVYLVYHRQTRSAYALKTFRDQLLNDRWVREQFRKEARIWVELAGHPNIVRAYQVAEFQGRLFIALEYIAPNEDGLNSLDGFLATMQPDLRQSLTWALQFCDGMLHAHGRGIRCHRDIKPANIMITRNKILKISDMGLAGALAVGPKSSAFPSKGRDSGRRPSLLSLRGAVGTPTHMPPEQFVDASLCDARSDIYSFGVVLFQMCNRGHLPFLAGAPRSSSDGELMRFWAGMKALHERAPVPKFSSPLQPIAQRCLEKDPRRRYEGFDHLRRDLAAVLKGEYNEVLTAPLASDLEAWELCNKGAALAVLGDQIQALACYDEALRMTPQLADAWNNKGVSLKNLGRFEEALNCFDAALTYDPRSAAFWSNKGLCLNALERHPEASRYLDQALDLDPHSAGCWLNKGNSLLMLGRMEEAHKCFTEALQLSPRYAGAWFRQGLCCQALRRLDEAVRCFDESIRLHPADGGAWCSKALCLSTLNKHEDALAVIIEARSITRLPSFAWFIKAGIEERLNKGDEAIRSYRQFLAEADEADAEQAEYARRELLRLEAQEEESADLRAAKESVDAAICSTPRRQPHVAALARLAQVYKNEGDYARAEAVYLAAIEIVEVEMPPDFPYITPLLNNLGSLCHSQGRLAQAQRLYERAVVIIENEYGHDDRNLGAYLTNLGVVYDDQGLHQEAQRAYRRALEIKELHLGTEDISLTNTLEHLAASLLRSGRAEEANGHNARAQRIRRGHRQ